jgi:hypothetical protein
MRDGGWGEQALKMACGKRSAEWIHENIVTRLLDNHLSTAHRRLQALDGQARQQLSTRVDTTHHDECDCTSLGYDLACSIAELFDPLRLPDSCLTTGCELLDPAIAGRLRWLAECAEPHVEWLWVQLEHFQYWHLAKVLRTRADLRHFLDAPPPPRADLAGLEDEDWINLDVDVGTLVLFYHHRHSIEV